jgi:hypothetical protein
VVRRLSSRKPAIKEVVATVCALAERTALALVPLNDGDDLHFLLVKPELVPRLKSTLGAAFVKAFEQATVAPLALGTKKASPRRSPRIGPGLRREL